MIKLVEILDEIKIKQPFPLQLGKLYKFYFGHLNNWEIVKYSRNDGGLDDDEFEPGLDIKPFKKHIFTDPEQTEIVFDASDEEIIEMFNKKYIKNIDNNLNEIEITPPIQFIIGRKYDFLDNDEEEGGPLEWVGPYEFVGMHRDSGNRRNYYVFDRPEGGTNIPEDFMKGYLKDKRVRYSSLNEIEIKSKYPLYQLGDSNSKRYYFGTENYDSEGWLKDNTFVFTLKSYSDEGEAYEVAEKLKSLNIPYSVEIDGEYDDGWKSYTNIITPNADKYFVFKKS